MALSVKHPTLDFGLGHNPSVMGSSPVLGIHTKQGVCLRFSLTLSKKREREKETSKTGGGEGGQNFQGLGDNENCVINL